MAARKQINDNARRVPSDGGTATIKVGGGKRTRVITNYQMALSKQGAGGGSATHKEPT